MQIHTLSPKTKNQKPAKVGRGGKRGKTSGRGHKGQKARSGHRIRPEIRDAIKKLPKLRGYRFASIETKPEVVNLSDLEAHFKTGETVTPEALFEKGLVRRQGGALPKVKVLGAGDIRKKLAVEGCAVSKSAREALEKAGGTVAE